jgi:hypothetical protein
MVADADPTHWLYRLSAREWLAAAETELAHCQEALARRAVRPGITYARRGAGMALNAVLRVREDPGYGRSYMEHVVALAGDPAVSAEVRAAAQALREMAPVPPQLISLGKPDLRALAAARAIADYARGQVSENG